MKRDCCCDYLCIKLVDYVSEKLAASVDWVSRKSLGSIPVPVGRDFSVNGKFYTGRHMSSTLRLNLVSKAAL